MCNFEKGTCHICYIKVFLYKCGVNACLNPLWLKRAHLWYSFYYQRHGLYRNNFEKVTTPKDVPFSIELTIRPFNQNISVPFVSMTLYKQSRHCVGSGSLTRFVISAHHEFFWFRNKTPEKKGVRNQENYKYVIKTSKIKGLPHVNHKEEYQDDEQDQVASKLID